MTDHSDTADSSPTEAGSGSPTNGQSDGIESRLRAVERAVTGTDTRPADVAAGAEAATERERLESRITDLEERVAELEAATQAVRGYVGSVRAVNREVERRADLALARATNANRESDTVDASGERDDRGEGVAFGADGQSAEGDATVNDSGGAVPSESALDAALPDDRAAAGGRADGGGVPDRGGGETSRDDAGSARGERETGRDGDDGAWATGALDRLRESL